MNKSHKKVNMTKYLVLPPSTLRVERERCSNTQILLASCAGHFRGRRNSLGTTFDACIQN